MSKTTEKENLWQDIDCYFREASLEDDAEDEPDYEFIFDADERGKSAFEESAEEELDDADASEYSDDDDNAAEVFEIDESEDDADSDDAEDFDADFEAENDVDLDIDADDFDATDLAAIKPSVPRASHVFHPEEGRYA